MLFVHMRKISKFHLICCQSVILTVLRSASINVFRFYYFIHFYQENQLLSAEVPRGTSKSAFSAPQATVPVAQGSVYTCTHRGAAWVLGPLQSIRKEVLMGRLCSHLSAGLSVFQRLRAHLLQLHIRPHQHRGRHCHDHQGRPSLPGPGVCSVPPHR